MANELQTSGMLNDKTIGIKLGKGLTIFSFKLSSSNIEEHEMKPTANSMLTNP
jgi:hypothetical protein